MSYNLLRDVVWPFCVESRKPVSLFLLALVAVAATATAHVATPWLIGRLIDAAPQKEVDVVRACAIGLFATALLASFGGGLRSVAARRLADLFRTHLRMRLMQRMLGFPLKSLEGPDSRALNSVFVDDVSAVANLANPTAMNVFLAILQFSAALTILVVRFGSLSWLVLFVVPLNAAISIWQWPLARKASREQLRIKTSLDSLTSETIEGIRDIKSLGAAPSIVARLRSLSSDDLAARWRAYVIGSVEHGRYAGTWLVMSVVYLVGAMAVVRGEMSIGSLTAFVFYVGFLDTPISRLWQTASEWQDLRASLERYWSILNLPQEDNGHIVLETSAPPEVKFKKVIFRYDGSPTPALSLDLHLNPGLDIAIVGASGAGKTTLASLLLRLFEPNEGSVDIAGRDIRHYTLDSLRRYVAIISQEPFIFDGTVRENICFGLNCNDSEVAWAAGVADAAEFIEALPDRYSSVLGARGSRLSGGQKRRLAIARAVIRRPRILILDEATGSLDSASDFAIQEAIARIGNDCTTISISHRLSSTSNADKIIVLDGGAVIGEGTHQELLRECSLYRNLAELQALEQERADSSTERMQMAPEPVS
jgi:ATP-binding cassette, subfamily B, bacterial